MAVYTTIDDPSAHFQVKTYTGNGNSGNALTYDGNSDLQPDLLWNKVRGAQDSHAIWDSTRGITKILHCNIANAETSDGNGNLESFDSDGFTVGGNQYYANHATTMVNWGWKANGGTTTAVSASGSGASQVLASTHQANTTAGFSIVRFTGVEANATVTHGLGAVPEMILFKNIISTNNWIVYHKEMGNDDGAYLNLDLGEADNVAFFNDTTPTSTLFSVGTNDKTNDSGSNSMIAYCFRSIQGYSKCGSYIGNGNADGTFVYTGFRPAWVMHKRIDSTGNWFIFDNKRLGYNSENHRLLADTNNTEADPSDYDLLSNGFKIRFTSGNVNADTGIYVYIAFAESPFVTSTGIPTTAR